MGVWNTATPAGSDLLSQGDDRIREMKSALEEALSHEYSTFPGASPGSAPIFIPGFLRGNTASRPTSNNLVEGRLYLNTTLNVIERYNGASWDSVGINIPQNTRMLFANTAVPTGWTLYTGDNGSVLRVDGSSGSGGTHDVSNQIVLAHTHTVASHTHTGPSHTHTISSDGSHTHSLTQDNPSGAEESFNAEASYNPTTDSSGSHTHGGSTGADGTGATGAASPATDSQLTSITLKYVNVLVGTKD